MHRRAQYYTRPTLARIFMSGLQILITCVQRVIAKPSVREVTYTLRSDDSGTSLEPREIFLHKIVNNFPDEQNLSKMLHSSYHHSHTTHYLCKTFHPKCDFQANMRGRFRVHEVQGSGQSDAALQEKWCRIVRALLVHEPRLLIALADVLMMLRIPRTMRWLMTFPKDSYGAYLSSL
jgi:hypothetical protein